MPKKFEGHAIKFFGTLKTKHVWLFHGHVASKKCNVFSHGPPPTHTHKQFLKPVRIISSLKWKWYLYFLSVFSKLRIKFAKTFIFRCNFKRNTGTVYIARLQSPLNYPPSILVGNYFKYMADLNRAGMHQLRQMIMVWFTKRRKRQLVRSACTNHAAKAFLKRNLSSKKRLVLFAEAIFSCVFQPRNRLLWKHPRSFAWIEMVKGYGSPGGSLQLFIFTFQLFI